MGFRSQYFLMTTIVAAIEARKSGSAQNRLEPSNKFEPKKKDEQAKTAIPMRPIFLEKRTSRVRMKKSLDLLSKSGCNMRFNWSNQWGAVIQTPIVNFILYGIIAKFKGNQYFMNRFI